MVQKERLAAEPPVASSAPNARAVLAPIAPERYKIQFTVPRETYDTLRCAQELLRHVVPSGDSAVIVGRALALLVADLEKRRGADVKQPRGAGTRPEPGASRRLAARETDGRTKLRRHIPAAVRRAVWARNEGRCAFVGTAGRCTERGLLEFHHVVPYADGGDATVGNLELRCRRHNRFEAERWFGEDRLPALVPETAPEWNEAEAGRPLVTETAGRSRCPSQG
jgi:5-methylcytosine-specific restriction endonuclease McrA